MPRRLRRSMSSATKFAQRPSSSLATRRAKRSHSRTTAFKRMSFENPHESLVVPEPIEILRTIKGAKGGGVRTLHAFTDCKRFTGETRIEPLEGLSRWRSLLSRALAHPSGECLEKRDEGAFFFLVEAAWADFRIERGIWTAAFGVELDHIFKRRQAAIVHVRRRAGGLAKRRRVERPGIPRFAGDCEPALIGQTAIAPGDAGVVEVLVGEVRPDMAGNAATLAAEHLQACFLESVQRIGPSGSVTVEARIAGPN